MTVYLVVLMSVLSQVGFSGSRVVVSLYALELGASQFSVGMIIALYSLCPMLLSIFIGRIADRTAPRLPVIAGCVAMALALLMPTLVGGVIMLGFVAFVLGLGHQLFSIPLEALVGGIGGPEKRASNYTLITMGWSVANMLGPLLAGFLIDSMGHVRVFYVLAAFIASPLLIIAFRPALLPAVSKHSVHTSVRGGTVADLWRIRPLRTIIIANGVVGSAHDLFQFYMPIYGHAIGLSASAIGTVLSMVALAAFVVRTFIPLLVKQLSEARILTLAVFLAAVAFALLPFFVNPYALATVAFALGLGVGCALPLTLSLLYLLSPAGRVAEAIGLNKTVRNATHLVVPIIFGSIGAILGYTVVFLSNAVLLTGGGLLMRRVNMRKGGS